MFTLRSTWIRLFIGVAIVAVVWGRLGAASAQPRPDITLWVEGDSVTAGEPFILNIEGSTPAHRGIWFPSADADSVFGGLEILERSQMYTRRVGGGYAIDSVAYTMRTSARDSVRIPPVPIRVDVAVGTLTTHTDPYTVWVRRDRQAASSGLFGTVAADAPAATYGWWGLVVGMIGLLGGGAYLWITRRGGAPSQSPPAPPQEPVPVGESDAPYETTRQRLRDLQARDRASPDAIEAFYVDLADAVRAYLSRRLGLPTRQHTTRELMEALSRRADVPPGAVKQLRSVLEEADRVKFAALRPAPATAEEALAFARAGLDAIEERVSAEDSAPVESASADAVSSSR